MPTTFKKLLVLVLGGVLAFASLGSSCGDEGSPPPSTPDPNGNCIGSTKCGNDCVNLQSNSSHCGACNKACASGQTCSNSGCITAPPPTECNAPKLVCSGSCTDVQTSTTHCGRCNNACPSGQSCSAGACVPQGGCPAGKTSCSNTCVDTNKDNNNCGGCGNVCKPPKPYCDQGNCIEG